MKGLSFATIDSLGIEQPFLTRLIGKRESAVVGHALMIRDDVYQQLAEDSTVELEWLIWQEALSMPWESLAVRALFEPKYVRCLKTAIEQVQAGREASVLLQSAQAAG